ncbi:RecB family exonuclease [Bremerella sp. P1]|uniref:RecB family exonuclease n=1 Tax=Bremerella sp. P1 TaxID=3026424 RepID=UPI002367499A|nr:PD-(D/E)XK nuclease family protein [Bremerella sp. P1]WDI40488.1 PD-(D/E)XK nuclease family protein [Bremerella sp. P1]
MSTQSHPCFNSDAATDVLDPASSKSVLTYSALNTFRNCPRKYKHRYVDHLRPRERPEALSFGSVIHGAIELWYQLPADDGRLWSVLDYIDQQFPERVGDEQQIAAWHLARAMITGYASRYPSEDFDVVEVEKTFTGEIRNPDTGRPSQTFVIAGKADAIVQQPDGMYLLEHKTASTIDANYLDKLWTDTQIALYSHYLRQLGYPIVGVIYNVLLKCRLKQKAGETQEEYEARRAELAAKNKSGRSTAKRQMPESDEEYQARLAEWYARPEVFHREHIYLSEDRLAMLQEEVWEITQQYLDARRRGKWLLNTSSCFSYQRPCEYLPYCQSGFNPNVSDNLYEIVPPHEELSPAESDAPLF